MDQRSFGYLFFTKVIFFTLLIVINTAGGTEGAPSVW